MPQEWPDGAFDLVVLSEVGYFLTEAELAEVAARVRDSLTGDGVLLACHWRHGGHGDGGEGGGVLSGDEVHEVLRAVTGLSVLVGHVEEDFRLEVLVPPPGTSVARVGGLLG